MAEISIQIPENPERREEEIKIITYLKSKISGVSKRQLIIFSTFAFVEFFAGTVISIQAPFFPDVADKKGATATEYGLVFGIFEIVVFIMSPIFGSKMNFLDPVRLFNLGILTSGICCVIFGLLNNIALRFPFIGACLAVRGIEALGHAAFVTGSFTIIAIEFPHTVATTFAFMETFYGLGFVVGPAIGGVLFEVGGFSLPFVSIGALHIIGAIASYFILPVKQINSDQKEIPTTSGFEMFNILKVPSIGIAAYSVVATAIGIGFLSANMEPYLRQFELNKIGVGAVFLAEGCAYCVAAPVWGSVCDHTDQLMKITFIGSLFTITTFLIIGPAPFLPFNPTLWIIFLAQILSGIGQGAVLVAAFVQFLQNAVGVGYPDDISTYGLVSGLWTSMLALGNFIGPIVGGILYDFVGFRCGSLFVIASQLILVSMICIHLGTKPLVAKKYQLGDPNPTHNEKVQIEFDIYNKNKNKTISTFNMISNCNLAFIEDKKCVNKIK